MQPNTRQTRVDDERPGQPDISLNAAIAHQLALARHQDFASKVIAYTGDSRSFTFGEKMPEGLFRQYSAFYAGQ